MSADMNNDIIISVEGLSKHYKSKAGVIYALDGITTDIRRGEVLVIIGPSGSGKSTFLRSLNLLERPTEGTITFEGVDITSPESDINKLRQKMGMVFQHFNLFPHLTILDNMTLAPRKLLKMSDYDATQKACRVRSVAFSSFSWLIKLRKRCTVLQLSSRNCRHDAALFVASASCEAEKQASRKALLAMAQYILMVWVRSCVSSGAMCRVLKLVMSAWLGSSASSLANSCSPYEGVMRRTPDLRSR